VPRALVMSQDVRMKKRTGIRISGRINRRYRGPCVGVTATGEFRDTGSGYGVGTARDNISYRCGLFEIDFSVVCAFELRRVLTVIDTTVCQARLANRGSRQQSTRSIV
jgi:hypothetical protein